MRFYQNIQNVDFRKTLSSFSIALASIVMFSGASFAENIASKQTPRMVEFYASWCEPCKQQEESLQRVQQVYGSDIQIVRCDVDDPQNAVLAKKYDVCLIPTVIFLDADNNVCARALGLNQDEVVNKCVAKILPSNQDRTKLSLRRFNYEASAAPASPVFGWSDTAK